MRLKLSGAACYKEKSVSRQSSIHSHSAHPVSHHVRSPTQLSFSHCLSAFTQSKLLFTIANQQNEDLLLHASFRIFIDWKVCSSSHPSPLPFSTTTNSNPNRVLADLHQNAVCVDTMDAGVKPLPSQAYSIPLTTLRMSSTKQQQPQLAATTS